MRILTIMILITLYVHNAYSYELSTTDNGNLIKWNEEEIDIYLDPSLNHYGEDAFIIIEESFLEWTDYIEQDIILNFIYEECTPWKENCIKYSDEGCEITSAACTLSAWNKESGYKITSNILFHTILKQKDFQYTVMHEIGHFFGLSHSNNHKAIMYPYITSQKHIHQDDINGIKTLYENGTIYPSIKEEPVEYHFNGCSFTNISNTTKSIFSLLF